MVELVVSFAAERLGDLLIEEFRLSNGVENQVKKLQTELKRMQCFLRDAERRQDEEETIKNWISRIRELGYDAEDVIEIYAIKVAYDSSFGTKNTFSQGKHLHKVGSEIKSINSLISDLKRSLQTYGLTPTRDNFVFEIQKQMRWTYSHVIEEFTVGLDKGIDQLVGWLLNHDQHCRVVYTCGMGGLGKTTLTNTIYHYNAIRHHFEGSAWAYISQKCNKRDIWEGILLSLTSSKEERDEIMKMRDQELAKKLYKVQQGKKCLIILDDNGVMGHGMF